MVKLKENALEIYKATNVIIDDNLKEFLEENAWTEVFAKDLSQGRFAIISKYPKTATFMVPKILLFTEAENSIEEYNEQMEAIEPESEELQEIIEDIDEEIDEEKESKDRKNKFFFIFIVIFLIWLLSFWIYNNKKTPIEETKPQEQIKQEEPEKDQYGVITENIVNLEQTIDEDLRNQEKRRKEKIELEQKIENSIQSVKTYRSEQNELYAKKINLAQ